MLLFAIFCVLRNTLCINFLVKEFIQTPKHLFLYLIWCFYPIPSAERDSKKTSSLPWTRSGKLCGQGWPFRSQSIDRSSVRRSIHLYEENQYESDNLSRSTSSQQIWSSPSSSSLAGSTTSLVKTAHIRKIEDMEDPIRQHKADHRMSLHDTSRGHHDSRPSLVSYSPSRYGMLALVEKPANHSHF